VTLLEDHTKELKRVIRPGARRLNWNSLGIYDYISKCVAVRPSPAVYGYSLNCKLTLFNERRTTLNCKLQCQAVNWDML